MLLVYALRLEGSDAPFYIGKGKGARKNAHFQHHRLKARSHKNNVIRKALKEGVSVLAETLFDNLSETDAFLKEIELIAFYGRRKDGGFLTNATDGGEGCSGCSPSIETREKLSAALKGRQFSDSTRSKMSASGKGRRKINGETRKKLSAASMGRKHSEKSRALMAAAATGRTHSAEAREKMSIVHRGLKHSDSTRSKMSAAHKDKTGAKNNAFVGIYVTPWGTFEAARDAANAAPMPISESTLSNYCRKYNNRVMPGPIANRLLNGQTPRERGFSFIPKADMTNTGGMSPCPD